MSNYEPWGMMDPSELLLALLVLGESLMHYVQCDSLIGVFAPQRRTPRGEKTVLAKESFWRLVFECAIDLPAWGERIIMGWENSYRRTVGLGYQWVAAL